jgi:uncharacterized oligopeptide transporter (OPT) family protein
VLLFSVQSSGTHLLPDSASRWPFNCYIFSFAILKPLSRVPTYFGGGYFGPRENCTVQTAATSAGGLTALFVAAVPAMYHLGLMTTPRQDIGRLFLLTAITAFYGLFFAIPLRKYYIREFFLV